MLKKTKGVVLHAIPYNDKYYIVHILTEEYGRLAFHAPRSKSKTSKLSKFLFLPMSVLELEIDYKGNKDLHRVKEAVLAFPIVELYADPVKNVLSLFLAEFMYRVLREAGKDEPLFDFVVHSIQLLELSHHSVANFHLLFLLRMTHYLGFTPNMEKSNQCAFFDLYSGSFIPEIPIHKHYLDKEEGYYFRKLMQTSFESMHELPLSRDLRVKLLERIIEYFRLHLFDFPEIKSLEILRTIFNN